MTLTHCMNNHLAIMVMNCWRYSFLISIYKYAKLYQNDYKLFIILPIVILIIVELNKYKVNKTINKNCTYNFTYEEGEI